MTCPSRQERSEIAARLRNRHREMESEKPPADPIFAAFVYLTNVMGAVRVGEGGNLFNRLADLIEPEPELTCRMHRDENGMWHCGNCDDLERGGDGIESWCDSWAPDFCPDCGARVVRQ